MIETHNKGLKSILLYFMIIGMGQTTITLFGLLLGFEEFINYMFSDLLALVFGIPAYYLFKYLLNRDKLKNG